MARWETHRSDANAEEIIAAWRRVGATVEAIGRPVDVVVGYKGVNYLAEIKTLRGKLRPRQEAFLETWRGQVAVIRTVAEGFRLIGVS